MKANICISKLIPESMSQSFEESFKKKSWKRVEIQKSVWSRSTGTSISRRSESLGMENLGKLGWNQSPLGCKNSRKRNAQSREDRMGLRSSKSCSGGAGTAKC